MKLSDAFPSNYLAKEDLPPAGQSKTFTIRDVLMETMPGETKEEKPVMYFSDEEKSFVLNITNFNLIAEIYGDDSDNWRGRQITLHIDPNIQYAGKRVGGIRVRGAIAPPTDGAPSTPNVSGVWTLQEAVLACKAAGVEKVDLIDKLKALGHTGWDAARDTAIAKGIIAAHGPAEESFEESVENEIAGVPKKDIPF